MFLKIFFAFCFLFVISCKDNKVKEPLCISVSHKMSDSVWNLRTSDGTDLAYILKSGTENNDSKIGCYASNAESYGIFKDFFDTVIEKYHNINLDKLNQEFDTNPNNLNIPDNFITKNKVISTRVRLMRNLSNFNFPSKMSLEERSHSEKLIVEALNKLNGKLKGKYYRLNKLTEEQKMMLKTEHLLFQDLTTDKYLKSAGIANDYPIGRGIFISNDKHLAIWVNEEDHLRITSIYSGYNFKKAISTINKTLESLDQNLNFAIDKKLGYLASCPTNIGTGMRASIMVEYKDINSENISEYKNKFKKINLQIRGNDGENSDSTISIFDISNSVRVGKTEIELINELHNKLVSEKII